MAKVILSAEMSRQAESASEVEVTSRRFPDLVGELLSRFPGLSEELVRKQSLAIDGMIVHEPLLETFEDDSELVFVARIAGG